jgi:hypothetical protein
MQALKYNMSTTCWRLILGFCCAVPGSLLPGVTRPVVVPAPAEPEQAVEAVGTAPRKVPSMLPFVPPSAAPEQATPGDTHSPSWNSFAAHLHARLLLYLYVCAQSGAALLGHGTRSSVACHAQAPSKRRRLRSRRRKQRAYLQRRRRSCQRSRQQPRKLRSSRPSRCRRRARAASACCPLCRGPRQIRRRRRRPPSPVCLWCPGLTLVPMAQLVTERQLFDCKQAASVVVLVVYMRVDITRAAHVEQQIRRAAATASPKICCL